MNNTKQVTFLTSIHNKYIMTRKKSLDKKSGISTKILSKAEEKEYLNNSLHKFRGTWNPRIEIIIAINAFDKVMGMNLNTKKEFITKITEIIKQNNQREFDIIKIKKDGNIKDAHPTRAQRAMIKEMIRFEIKRFKND